MTPSKCLCLQKVWEKLFGRNKEVRVLLVGLDSAGKTTTLYQLKLGEVVTTIPTIGFNVETVCYNDISFTCWDVGGKDKIRPLWRHYYQNTQALIFVVDSNDRDRIDAARDELWRFMSEQELQDVVVLVLANKQDLPNAMPGPELIDQLGLHGSRRHPWHLQPTSAVTGEGLHEGLDWLVSAISEGHQKSTSKEVNSPLIKKTLKTKIAPSPLQDSKDKKMEGAMDDFLNRSFTIMQLEPEVASIVKHALNASSVYLSERRSVTEPSDEVQVSHCRNFEANEAHWPKDRSQLRLVEQSNVWQWILGALTRVEQEEEHIAALRKAREALITFVESNFGGRNTARLVADSTLDAFYYDLAGLDDKSKDLLCATHTDACALTLIVSDAPGLEARNVRTGEWVPLSLRDGEVALIAGRSARAAGFNVDACEHRVVRCHHGASRASITLDLHVTPLASK